MIRFHHSVFFVLVVALGMMKPAFSQITSPLAVIMHVNNPTTELSFVELHRIFRLDRQYWPDGSQITVLLPGPAVPERLRIIQRVFLMSEQTFRQHWIALSYQVKAVVLPKPTQSCESTLAMISSLESSIGVVDSDCVDDRVKVILIDGLLPNEKGYRL